jgi:D-beta-D-heptose 7-phosphate kinase/D-beta-D-heptose 1-phosphate adenosyltransferase
MRELPDFSKTRLLVVGDVMLDRYWHGATSRISPEAPVPVVRVDAEEARPGGAGNVALNVAALGAEATLLGLTGDDDMARLLEQQLGKRGVRCRFDRLERFATITKLRVVSRHQQLIRLDFEDGFPGYDAGDLLADYARQVGQADVVVLSDYAKGTLREAPQFIAAARAAGRPVLVDPKGADFTRYRGATLLTPNLAELEAVVGRCPDEAAIVARGQGLMADCALEALLVTRGEHGMTLLARDRPPLHLPAQAREVYDITGAGDTVIAVLAAALAAGVPIESATALANTAAGIVVGKLGTACVTPAELHAVLGGGGPAPRGVLDEERLAGAIAAARARGETVVLTNGCFDILHAGHVAYLEEASRLGDRLVVAVNVDDTVRRLKGEGRPVNPLDSRLRVLAALACVDWVVPFSEDTPERLICRLRPDVLVKGGDHDPATIAGGDCVRAAGGQVRSLGYVEGVSTTRIIEILRGDGPRSGA